MTPEIRKATEILRALPLILRTGDEPFRPDSLYGVWKAFGETLGRYYSDKYGLQVTSVRIGVLSGAIHTGPESTCRITRGPTSEPL